MKPRNNVFTLLALAGCIGLFYAGRAALRAHQDLVTLNVRNMQVRRVVKKIEWQTWETILLNKEVQGKVTLNVRNAPLESVLKLVAGQVSARSSQIYPIYHKNNSVKRLHTLIEQESAGAAPATYWTNFSVRGTPGGGGFRGGFGGMDSATNPLISLHLENKEPNLAALTLSFATRTQVVPEDGIDLKVNLVLENATRDQAVKKFAKALFRNWNSFYVLQPARLNLAR